MCCFKGGKQLTEGGKSQTRRRRGTSNSCVSHNHSLVLGNQTLVLKLIKKHKLQSTGRNYDSTVLTAKNHALFCKASHGKIDLFECAAELPEILGRVIGSITWSVISGSHQKPIKGILKPPRRGTHTLSCTLSHRQISERSNLGAKTPKRPSFDQVTSFSHATSIKNSQDRNLQFGPYIHLFAKIYCGSLWN